MRLEERHLDFLQNIEFTIVSVYREFDDLTDYEVIRALDAVIDFYRAAARGFQPREITLPEKESLIVERVTDICEFRLGRKAIGNTRIKDQEKKTAEDAVACLRKIRKSVERWNNRGGRQGYLIFVSEFV